MNSDFASYWPLDPDVTYLNHGAYGACPWPVLRVQDEWRARLERQPTQFMGSEVGALMAEANGQLAEFLHADADDLAFVPNATAGVNTILAALAPTLRPGDEILTTDHEYNACLNAMRRTAAAAGATVVVAHLPLPLESPGAAAVEAILGAAGPRTKLAVISHITSSTALVLPIAQIVAGLAERGIDTLVDGAHAPGMVDLDIDALGAAYYTGNCHKWLCAPKGSGFVHVRRDRQALIHPLVTSHGANAPRGGQSLFRLEFDWTGTSDPTPYLSIPAALEFMGTLVPGGWPEVMQRNRQLALTGRRRLMELLGNEAALAPEEMIGSMSAVELSPAVSPSPSDPDPESDPAETYPLDPLHDSLINDHRIEVPVYAWPNAPADGGPRRRLLRVSAQLYNSAADYDALAVALGSPAG